MRDLLPVACGYIQLTDNCMTSDKSVVLEELKLLVHGLVLQIQQSKFSILHLIGFEASEIQIVFTQSAVTSDGGWLPPDSWV